MNDRVYAEWLSSCPDGDVSVLRELLCFDALCPNSCDFVRHESGGLMYRVAPSPMHWSRQFEWPWSVREGDYLPGHRVLDVGGGWAVNKYSIASRVRPGGSFVTVDINADGLKCAEQTYESFKRFGFNNLEFKVCDARNLPYPYGSFDRVLCISTLEHIQEGRVQVMREMLRVLKPGGVLLLTMDVAVRGKGKCDNYLGPEDVPAVLALLGLEAPPLPSDFRGFGVLENGEVLLAILAVRYVKP